MSKIKDYKHLNSLNYLQYKDQKGSEHSLKVKVNFNNESKILHITSFNTKASNLVMDIDLGSEVQGPNNRSLCDYTINYMDENKNLKGIEFGKACILEDNKGKIKLRSLNESFSLNYS